MWKKVAFLLVLVNTACSSFAGEPSATGTVRNQSDTEAGNTIVTRPSDTDLEGDIRINKRIDDPNTYSFPQLLPFDGIRPVYDPEFVTARESPLQEDELILGITLERESKAYPITVLRHREMVNDELAGIPILVTW